MNIFEVLTLASVFWMTDIQQSYKLLQNKNASNTQIQRGVERLVSYGELSYCQLKGKTWGLGDKVCKVEVWPRVLAPRTRRLVSQLGNDKFLIRQRASEELMEIGPYNRLILLQEVGKTNDVEIVHRLNRLLETMPVNK